MDNQIVILRGAERVRKRPAVIFGSDGMYGVAAAVQMLLDIVAEEGAKGYCDCITITGHQDGSVGIQDNGRGIFLGDGMWENLFCQLFAQSPYCDAAKPGNIFEVPGESEKQDRECMELCAVQYASEYMDVCVHRDGYAYRLHFEKGENIGGLTTTPSAEPTGTYIRFKPDAAVFTQIDLPAEVLTAQAQLLAMLHCGMQVCYRRETATGYEETVFCYETGIADYLQEKSINCTVSEIYTAEIAAEGQDRYNRPKYAAAVKIGLCFSKEPGFVECYHNHRALPHGGSHLDQLLIEVRRCLEKTMNRKIRKQDLLAHLRLVAVSDAEITYWVNGTRNSIQNVLIRDMAQDAIRDRFHSFAERNKEVLAELFCE